MLIRAALVVAAAMLCACWGKEAPQVAATQPAKAEQPPPPKRSPLDPPPPAGVVLPLSARLRAVHGGDKTTAYFWMAVYDADVHDPGVKRVLAAAAKDGMTLDPGDAAVAAYADELRAAGIEVIDMVSGFMYRVEPGALDVIVRCDDDFHRDDPTGFTIFVGPAGG